MGVHWRRFCGTGALCAAVWTAFTTLSSPPPGALGDETFDAPAAVSTARAPALASLEAITLRPFVALREPGEQGIVIAHRGDPATAPENTMPAFEATASAGAEYFEIDLRLSKDGVPVVIHDKTVDRTTDGSGAVAEMTLDELRILDAGSWFSPAFAGTPIPTLEEVLGHAASTGTTVLIEYKGTWSEGDIRTTLDLIEAARLEGKVIAQSFSKKTVANFSALAPGLPVGWLTEKITASTVSTAQKIGADAVNPRRASAHSVALAHGAGLGVFAWTHDDGADWETLTEMGVDGIITNRPSALHEWMLERP